MQKVWLKFLYTSWENQLQRGKLFCGTLVSFHGYNSFLFLFYWFYFYWLYSLLDGLIYYLLGLGCERSYILCESRDQNDHLGTTNQVTYTICLNDECFGAPENLTLYSTLHFMLTVVIEICLICRNTPVETPVSDSPSPRLTSAPSFNLRRHISAEYSNDGVRTISFKHFITSQLLLFTDLENEYFYTLYNK